MGVISDPAHSNGDVMRRLRDLERTVQQQAAARRLESASVGAGGVTIRGGAVVILDDQGETTTVLGKLPADSSGAVRHGVAAIDPTTGALVELSALAFRQATASVAAREARSLDTYGDLTTPGPKVSGIQVGSSGKMVVEVGCRLFFVAGPGTVTGGLMGFEVSGPTDVAPAVDRSVEASLQDVAGQFGLGRQFLLTGLAAGMYTVTAKYRASTAGQSCDFFERIIAISAY